eukprot:TRINITY_DN4155_c0_g5_i3.p1 TRINITY_DN4155_c0_g5~~TRINITY_DN4155_c0_g5_i3.p1  ORF type:complete len:286 (-),score=51.15 TRINITY_DN4155_c0_g5_i3:74-931(-)
MDVLNILSDTSERSAALNAVNGITIALFALAEIFCIYSNVRCFAIRAYRKEIPIIAVYIASHLTLLFTIAVAVKDLFGQTADSVAIALNNLGVLAKDVFLLTLTCRILDFVSKLEEENRLPIWIMRICWIIIPVHFIVLIVLNLLFYGTEKDLRKDSPYIICYTSGMQAFIGIFYIYTCAKAIPHFRELGIGNLDGHAKWLFVTIVYMIVAFTIRLLSNIGQIFNFQDRTFGDNRVAFKIYVMNLNLLNVFIPAVLICYCLLRMALDCSSEDNMEDGAPLTKNGY